MLHHDSEILLNRCVEKVELVAGIYDILNISLIIVFFIRIPEFFNEQLVLVFKSQFKTGAPFNPVFFFFIAVFHSKVPRVVNNPGPSLATRENSFVYF